MSAATITITQTTRNLFIWIYIHCPFVKFLLEFGGSSGLIDIEFVFHFVLFSLSLSSLLFSSSFFRFLRHFDHVTQVFQHVHIFSMLRKSYSDAIEAATKYGERTKIISILYCKIANFFLGLKWRSTMREYCQIKTDTYTCDFDNFTFFFYFFTNFFPFLLCRQF